MHPKVVRFLMLAASTMAGPRTGVAQEPAPPTVRAAPLVGVIHLDGVPDELAWRAADSITAFRQQDPAEGEPGTRRTVVRVLAGDAGMYVGVWMEDERPDRLVRAHVRRDDDLEADDYFALLIDSQHDRRSGYVFGTNPNGMLFDGEVENAEDLNTNWNGVWDVQARVGPSGWTAEFYIPWQNLRYRVGTTQLGFNVERLMRRTNEEVLWTSWRRQQGLLFQEAEGTLVLPAPLGPRGIVEARPYVAASVDGRTRSFSVTGADSVLTAGDADAKAGFDAKVAVAPTLALDLTVNTDFAQVEADRQVVNLSRFPVFFPEQRQFFLESAASFQLGQSERTLLFHSRTIGLDSVGGVVPIVAGARLIGRLGHERLGLLAVRTGGREDAVDAVARVQHDVFSRGYVGAMGTYQGGPGLAGEALGAGVDFAVPLQLHGQNLVPQAFVAATRSPAGRPWASAWRIFLDYPNDWADNFLAISRIEQGFDPALGFVLQSGVQRQTGAIRIFPRPGRWGIRRLLVAQFAFDLSEHLNGSLDNANYTLVPIGAQMESGEEFRVELSHNDDVPPDSFEIYPGSRLAPGRYGWNRATLALESSPTHPVVVALEGSTGGFYDGSARELQYEVSLRLEPHVIAGIDGGWQRVRFASSRFTAQVHRLRLDYARDPRLNGTVFLQWDNESNRLAVNGRLHWIPRSGSDAYLVWNSAWPTGLASGIPWSRPAGSALIGKLVYYFRM
ncbi:MAG TPA: DUF5916 domain-containing protein [Gemmatimonadales bacterium]|nr:DUF5916 domain-containing protein [Gemmatimonadales bacterium]